MTRIDTFLNDAAAADAFVRGSTAIVTPKGGDPVTLNNVIVLTDPLAIRRTMGDKALSYPVIVQIPKASYPDASGEPGGAPLIKGDRVGVKLRAGDAAYTTRTIVELIAQTNGMWTFGLE